MSHHEDSSSDNELDNNSREEPTQSCWIHCRSGVAVVVVITATITFETALHAALGKCNGMLAMIVVNKT